MRKIVLLILASAVAAYYSDSISKWLNVFGLEEAAANLIKESGVPTLGEYSVGSDTPRSISAQAEALEKIKEDVDKYQIRINEFQASLEHTTTNSTSQPENTAFAAQKQALDKEMQALEDALEIKEKELDAAQETYKNGGRLTKDEYNALQNEIEDLQEKGAEYASHYRRLH